MKIFSGTILSEAQRPQIECLSPKGEFSPARAPLRGHHLKKILLSGKRRPLGGKLPFAVELALLDSRFKGLKGIQQVTR